MVSVVLPCLPSLVAMIVTMPFFLAVTRPEAEIVARLGDDVDHVTARPVSTLPLAARSTAVACVVFPSSITPDATDTDTVATDCGGAGGSTGGTGGGTGGGCVGGTTGGGVTGGALTTIDDTALLPSAVAAMFARPALSARTTPADTAATVVSLLDQNSSGVVAAPASTCAASASVPPTTIVAFGGVIVIAETSALRVTAPSPHAASMSATHHGTTWTVSNDERDAEA